MVKKSQKPETAAPESPAGMPPPNDLKGSAQHIWLAGLGAFSKVQAEGGKVFETLVKDGLNLQRKTQKEAEERLAEAASRLSNMGTGWPGQTLGPMDKLETIFEDRVAKALHKLGMPSAQDLAALVARVDELQQELAHLKTPSAKPRAPRKSAPRPD